VVNKKLKRLTSLLLAAFFLSACGSGGSSKTVNSVTVNPPAQPELPAPEQPAPEQCSNVQHSIVSASDDGTFEVGYPPSKAIDNNTTSESRWSSEGVNKSLSIDLGSVQTVGALKIKWYRGAERQSSFFIETSSDQTQWTEVLSTAQSSGRHSGFELVNVTSSQARYIRITGLGNTSNDFNSIVELEVHQCEDADGLIIDTFPNEVGIDLADWYLSVPTDEDNSGTSDSIYETELVNGYTNSEFFYASPDNGIVMRSPSYGFKTSTNTSYVRVELREMLRRGDRSIRTQGVGPNNWVFGSAPTSAQANAGGVNGELNVTLAVNKVTTTGANYQIGRVVIGQIHANDDEPIRLYYRKLPNNTLGSIYFAHESRQTDSDGKNIETWVEMIGSRSNSASNPSDGIALDEKFSYRIEVVNNLLSVTISREGKPDVVQDFDMSNSLYDDEDQYQYFKVGVYHLNNTSDTSEYAQAAFYEIRNSHTGYAASE